MKTHLSLTMNLKLLTTIALSVLISNAFSEDVYVRELVVIHTTAKAHKAQTDDNFAFRVVRPTSSELSLKFPELPENEREQGKVDTYKFDISDAHLTSIEAKECKFYMSSQGPNAWLPSHFTVQGVMNDGSIVTFIDRNWPVLWFSTEIEYAEKGHKVYERRNLEGGRWQIIGTTKYDQINAKPEWDLNTQEK